MAMQLAGIREFEPVSVLDVDNGARFETYAMAGDPGAVIPSIHERPASSRTVG